MKPMILSLPSSRRAAAALARGAKLRVAPVRVSRFPDGETRVRLPSGLVGKRAILVAPEGGGPADVWPFLLAIRAAREAGAAPTVVFPTLAYARADTAPHGEPRTALLFADLLRAAGAGPAIVIAPHSTAALRRLPRRPRVIEPLPALARRVARAWMPDAVVAPDEGAAVRARAVGRALGLPVTVLRKTRLGPSTVLVRGDAVRIGRAALIVDDLISTGATLAAAAGVARRAGAADVRALVVHGPVGRSALARLGRAGVRTLWVTDTRVARRWSRVRVLPLLASVGKRLRYGR